MTKLTDYEMEVLGRLAQGYNQKEAAKQLGLNFKALNGAVMSIRKKHRSLQKAIEWYMEQNRDVFEQDELPDEDEPTGPVQRCGNCEAVLSGPGIPKTKHVCLNWEDHVYRQHNGTVSHNPGSSGYRFFREGGEEPSLTAGMTAPVGAGRKRRG